MWGWQRFLISFILLKDEGTGSAVIGGSKKRVTLEGSFFCDISSQDIVLASLYK